MLPKHVNAADSFIETSLGMRLASTVLGVILFAKATNEDEWQPYDIDELASYGGGDHENNVALIEQLISRGLLVGTADGKVMVTEQMLTAIEKYIE